MLPSLQHDAISSVTFGTDTRVLDALNHTRANLAVWHRQLPAQLSQQLAMWARQLGTVFNEVVHPSDYDLSPLFRAGPCDAARTWLTRDVGQLVASFAEVSRSPRIRLRLGPVSDDRCRKFHVDYLRWRLVTTYVGPATMWIADEHVRRGVLRDTPVCPDEANRLILRAGGHVNQAEAGDVLLMKGENSGSPGLVHRSPPVEETGCCRLVLVMSSVDDADAESPLGGTVRSPRVAMHGADGQRERAL